MQLPQTLSPSSVGQFLKCPYKWYCDKASYPQIKTDDSALLFGKAIHMIIENYYTKIPEIITEKDIQKYLDESLIESGGWITDRFKTKTKKFYDNFTKHEKERIKNNIPKPTHIEVKYSIKLFEDLPKISGIIDSYNSKIGLVIDWKTGADATISNDQLIQGKIYEMLLKSQKLPVKSIVFVYIVLGVSPTIPEVNDAFIYSTLKNVCDAISMDKFDPKPSGLCSWCGYQLRCHFKDVNGWLV